jgi:hypothetical protein
MLDLTGSAAVTGDENLRNLALSRSWLILLGATTSPGPIR